MFWIILRCVLSNGCTRLSHIKICSCILCTFKQPSPRALCGHHVCKQVCKIRKRKTTKIACFEFFYAVLFSTPTKSHWLHFTLGFKVAFFFSWGGFFCWGNIFGWIFWFTPAWFQILPSQFFFCISASKSIVLVWHAISIWRNLELARLDLNFLCQKEKSFLAIKSMLRSIKCDYNQDKTTN